MAYQEDLTFYEYWPTSYSPVLAVGWLEGDNPYTVGQVSIEFLQKLRESLSNKNNIINITRGIYECNLVALPNNANEWYKDEPYVNDPGAELHVKYQDRYYASPTMIYEYIYKYGYQPPSIYIEALMNGEIIDSEKKIMYDEKAEIIFLENNTDACREKINQNIKKCETYIHNNQWNNAKDIINKTLLLSPNHPSTIFYLVRILLNDCKYKEGLSTIEKHQNTLGNMLSVRGLKAILNFHLGNLSAAKNDLQMLLPSMRLRENKHNYVQGLYFLGKIALIENEKEKAKSYFSEAAILAPNDKEIAELAGKKSIKSFLQKLFGF